MAACEMLGTGARALKSTAFFLGLAATVVLTACDKPEAILQGERENIRSILSEEAARRRRGCTENQALPLSLPATRANADWTQSIATPATRTAHPALRGRAAAHLVGQHRLGRWPPHPHHRRPGGGRRPHLHP